MKKSNLEERVAALEKEVAVLKAASANGQKYPNWQSTIGAFAGDPFMNEVFDRALAYREADRKKARRQFARKRKVKV